jgi:hypothetical protein
MPANQILNGRFLCADHGRASGSHILGEGKIIPALRCDLWIEQQWKSRPLLFPKTPEGQYIRSHAIPYFFRIPRNKLAGDGYKVALTISHDHYIYMLMRGWQISQRLSRNKGEICDQ